MLCATQHNSPESQLVSCVQADSFISVTDTNYDLQITRTSQLQQIFINFITFDQDLFIFYVSISCSKCLTTCLLFYWIRVSLIINHVWFWQSKLGYPWTLQKAWKVNVNFRHVTQSRVGSKLGLWKFIQFINPSKPFSISRIDAEHCEELL